MNPSVSPLSGIRLLSLALNLPGPAALMRCRRMGAVCTKLEPPAGDPMRHYNPAAYDALHQGMKVISADLKTQAGRDALHHELESAQVLLTSFRPGAMEKIGLGWAVLHGRHPALSQVAIVGEPGARADEPGHDLTYLAAEDLVCGVELPATLYADMAGSLMAAEAVLQAVMLRTTTLAASGHVNPEGRYFEVALADAAGYLALPRRWGLTRPTGAVGGAHAGYKVYPCKDGRVAVAALEPHFARALCAAAGLAAPQDETMFEPGTHDAIARFLASKTRRELDRLALDKDIPLHTLA